MRSGARQGPLLLVSCVVAAVAVYACTTSAMASRGAGKDLRPLHDAGAAVLAHGPVYAVPGFVYPPVAALVAAPSGAVPFAVVLPVFTALALISTGATVALTAALLTRRRWLLGWPVVAALALAALFASEAVWRSVRLSNVSLLLPPVVLVACWAFSRGRWNLGAALVVVSLVVKPLLLALLLVPLLRGRYRVVVVWVVAAGALTALASLVLGLGPGAVGALRSLLAASYFTGRWAPNNLSLSGFGLVHSIPAAATGVVRVLLVVAVAVVLVRTFAARADLPADATDRLRVVLAAATAAQATLLLVSPISEVHYLPLLLPGLAAAATSRRPWPLLLSLAGVGAFLLARGNGTSVGVQALMVATQALALAACAALLLAQPRVGRATV